MFFCFFSVCVFYVFIVLSVRFYNKSLSHDHRPISHHFRDKWRYTSKIATKIANFSYPRVLNVPAEGVPFGIWYRHKGSRMLLGWGYQTVEKVLR